jgi:lipopolysaccharide biosynthesis regulator YciM
MQHWQMALDDGAAWAIEALHRIGAVASESGRWEVLESACDKVLERQPHSWRVQLIMARMHQQRGNNDEARDALTRALTEKPGSITVQRELWQLLDGKGLDGSEVGALFERAIAEARLVDPYICLKCGFKATEPFSRCPHCHDWNTVADEQG